MFMLIIYDTMEFEFQTSDFKISNESDRIKFYIFFYMIYEVVINQFNASYIVVRVWEDNL